MTNLQLSDPFRITTEMLTDYVREQFGRPAATKTAESLAHLLAGIRVSEYYRTDISEADRTLLAREFLRGVLADDSV